MVGVQRWVLRAGLFILPLAYLPDTYDRWVLPKLLAARLLVLALAAVMAVRAFREQKLVLKHTPLGLPWIALVASAAVSSAFAFNVNAAIFGTYSRYDGLLTLLTYAALFWLAVQTLDTPGDARALARTLLASAYVVAAIAIAQSTIDSMGPIDPTLRGTDAVQGSVVRAYGSLGQWEVLAEFLVLAWPFALWESAVATSLAARLLAINASVVIALALLLTFSRSGWAAAVLAVGILCLGIRRRPLRGLVVAGLGVIAALALLGVAVSLAGGARFESAITARASTILHPEQWDARPFYWRDSLQLIASRPVLGYGPDNVGLVFGRFESVDYHVPIDKAHAEVLQVGATQGVVGILAYAWLLGAFAFAFWRGRRQPAAYAFLAGVVAYEAMLQVNFTALGSAFPFWGFAAAAMHGWNSASKGRVIDIARPRRLVLAAGMPVAAVMIGVAIVAPYASDVNLLTAVADDFAGDTTNARASAAEAWFLSPRESVYAVEVGNVAFEHSDWQTARAAYTAAAQLGTYNPLVYRNLALADRALGLNREALAAARAAYELNRFDPVNQALLAQFEQARNLSPPGSDS